MINTVIFDIGNVLVPFNWEETFKKCLNEEEFKIVSEATVLDTDAWNELDKGVLTKEEIFQLFYNNAPMYKKQIDTAVTETYKNIFPFSYSEKLIKTLKENGYKVYLLSNFGDFSFNLSKENFTFMNYIDGGVISYEVKLLKPSEEIYKATCDKYSINPSEAVFLDDNADNIEGAKKFGLNTIHFSSLENALEEFKNLGVNFDFSI